ncbi:1,4-dihydroxy-2-naphthoate octaprenyltransferase [Dokdonia sp. Dokd-P16]|uniref:1,4-dihydroxy-2-naphthoate octaprenyltransferase n=1 Tax=Dokdonia sp. Dokd-P16 TaxID=2173169 RepID=UPI000D54696B|nr:1,4-dihydroxy-2-naphthoate octaprenyltransferase [Dokdonia sp. Dokd-P16]AWH72797.1 1,4-dihydroxy-2-naphthoate octaprenyltransferase [Dokdonia sp. Dokd-P16]
MPSFQVWLSAARPRTLPLSIAGILVGGGLALQEGAFNWSIFILAILATLGFQILSNYANDYGDGVKGTDNAERVGPARAMQSGLLTAQDLKKAIIITSIITVFIVLLLIYVSFGVDHFLLSILFLLLGVAAIVSAIKYTVGKSAYGYRGLGDVFVFIFFGLVGVLGSFFLFTQYINFIQILPALTIGALSTMVLHLNNMRDREADARVGKNTLAVVLGAAGAEKYHSALFVLGLLGWVSYLMLTATHFIDYISLVAFIPLVKHMFTVRSTSIHALLDPELKKVALSTFLLAILFFISCYI